jgi:hypothetical protein
MAYRLAAALLTFIAGVAVVTLLIYRHDAPSVNKIEIVAQSQAGNQVQPAQSPAPADDTVNPMEAAFIKGDKLSYAGYDVERSFDAATSVSSAIIKKNGKTVTTLSNGGLGRDSTEIGLFSFLAGNTKQLVILQYTGGAHCCWIYKIYDFSPKLRLLFDGEKFGVDSIGYELYPKDIDGDGRYEFIQAVMTFDYFHMSHSSSVFPSAVFSYSEKTGMYLPANHKFSSYLLTGMEKDLNRVEEERVKIEPNDVISHERYLSAVLQVLLKYIYAGKEADGWEFFDHEYNLNNKGEIKVDIRNALKSDPIYQSIYRRSSS